MYTMYGPGTFLKKGPTYILQNVLQSTRQKMFARVEFFFFFNIQNVKRFYVYKV